MEDRALYLPMEAGWEMESIEEALGVSVRSIEQWEENYIAHGCVKPPRSIIGRPKLLTADTIEKIQKLLRKDPILLLDKNKEWLAL